MTDDRIAMSRRAFAGMAVTLAACGTALFAAGGPAVHTVNMAQMRYGPIPGDLKVGDSIVWVNKDTVVHTVTARDGSFDVRIDPGKRATQTLTKAGTFAFYCILHPTMRGTLKVAAS
jgi:plastocyanin